ncbi:MAG: glycosyltransferase family 2 protein [Planctomycetes bacterium]|nr:glycosyltransferase family 2 protein [Planctomycetota bacterium]
MTQKDKTIALLMLCYNGAADGLEAIESLSDQREAIIDIFISDNNSNDENKKLLQDNAQRLSYNFLNREENLGFAGGFNDLFQTALKESKADYFLVLNNDTEAEEGFIEQLLAQATPEHIVSPMILWHKDRETVIQCAGEFDLNSMKMSNRFADQKRGEVPPGVHQVGQTDGCCFMIHRSWLEKGFLFDPKLFIYFEDVELFTRLNQAGASFHYVTQSVLLHKEYGSSGGREKPSAFRNYYFYRNRLYLARKYHKWPGRWRIYYSLIRLALEKRKEQKAEAPQAAKAISQGIKDFFTGRMGRQYVP